MRIWKLFFRAITHITGFILRSRQAEHGCVLNYVAQCDPQGKLPPWLVNKVTHTLGPRMIKDLRKAALGYVGWKQNQSHFRKPWRFPEDITVPRILITDCWDASEPVFELTTPSAPSTPIAQPKPAKITTMMQSNGDSNPSSANNSPISQKKTKKKFKFKFDKWNDKKIQIKNVSWIVKGKYFNWKSIIKKSIFSSQLSILKLRLVTKLFQYKKKRIREKDKTVIFSS